MIPPRQGRDGFEGDIAKYERLAILFFTISVALHFELIKIDSFKLRCVIYLVSLGFAFCRFLIEEGTKPPAMDPHTYCSSLKFNTKKKAIVFLGDSITHQALSGEFVKMVAAATVDTHDVINCGQNSICTHTVLKERVSWVKETEPEFVFLNIGTNDIKGIYKPEWGEGSHTTWKMGKEKLSLKQFTSNYDKILLKLLSENKKATVVVHTLCPLGENLECEANKQCIAANAIILELASKHKAKKGNEGRVRFIDNFGLLERYLKANTTEEFRNKSLKVDNFGSVGIACAFKKHGEF